MSRFAEATTKRASIQSSSGQFWLSHATCHATRLSVCGRGEEQKGNEHLTVTPPRSSLRLPAGFASYFTISLFLLLLSLVFLLYNSNMTLTSDQWTHLVTISPFQSKHVHEVNQCFALICCFDVILQLSHAGFNLAQVYYIILFFRGIHRNTFSNIWTVLASR